MRGPSAVEHATANADKVFVRSNEEKQWNILFQRVYPRLHFELDTSRMRSSSLFICAAKLGNVLCTCVSELPIDVWIHKILVC